MSRTLTEAVSRRSDNHILLKPSVSRAAFQNPDMGNWHWNIPGQENHRHLTLTLKCQTHSGFIRKASKKKSVSLSASSAILCPSTLIKVLTTLKISNFQLEDGG